MYRIILLIGLIFTMSAKAQIPEDPKARKVAPEDVPNLIVANFNNRGLNTIPSWTDNGDTYMAFYRDTLNLGHIITYDKNGNLVSLQDELGPTAYPAAIERYHDRRFPNEKFTVWLNTDASGNRMYYFTRQKETIWFDPLGNVVEKSENKKVKQP
jgi:hypothetical protein